MTRRVEGATGSALSEIGKRGRRQQSKKLSKRRRKQEIQAEVTAAKFIEKEGTYSFSKFRACCNQPRKDVKDEQGDHLTYQGIEDRWLHDKDYRIKQIASNYCADQDVARHRDCQAAMFFQDNHMDPYKEEASVVTLLTLARDWIKKTAQRIQEQSAMALAREVAKSTAEVRPELSRGDYDLILK